MAFGSNHLMGRTSLLPTGSVLAFCAMFSAAAIPASARTWHITPDGSGDAPTIQAGVDSASAGDVVLVAAGTYPDFSTVDIAGVPTAVCVSIAKDISLIGEAGADQTTIGSPGADVAVYLHDIDADATVSGFRIETVFEAYACVDPMSPRAPSQIHLDIGIRCDNAPASLTDNHIINNGIGIVLNASAASLSGNTVDHAFFGVECKGGSNAEILNNVIHDCAELIQCEDSAPCITGNDLHDGCTAVSTLGASLPVIRGNAIHAMSPVAIDCGSPATIETNRFFDLSTAVSITVWGVVEVRENVFYNTGIALRLTHNTHGDITIEANTIDNNAGDAIFCDAGSSPLIRRNVIARTGEGVACGAASYPTIECNDLFDVTSPYFGCPDQTGINGNIAVDPQFCGVAESGNYYLQSDSPCAPGNHPDGFDCGTIGAFGVGCGTVSTKATTWGHMKAIYTGKKK